MAYSWRHLLAAEASLIGYQRRRGNVASLAAPPYLAA